jgi:DUF4097 and DUF4098 domain-containing protein YvlB
MVRGQIAFAVTVAITAPLSAQSDKVWDWSGKLAAGRQLTVSDVNGSVTATAASGDKLLVRATKQWKRGDPKSVEVRVVTTDDGLTFCAVHLSRAKDATTCDEKNSHGWDRNDDVSVNFDVQVPAGVRFKGESVNGSVVATGLTADAEVESTNGDVRVETTGTAVASTTNGSVHARVGKAAWKGKATFESTNGDVVVELPASANLDIDASTTNGSISSDFPVTIQGKMSPQSMHGRIGQGGQVIELSTTNGNIKIIKGS